MKLLSAAGCFLALIVTVRAATVENGSLSLTVGEQGDLTVVDRSSGRRWQASGALAQTAVRLSDFEQEAHVLRCAVRQPGLGPVRATLTLEGRELDVRLEAPTNMPLTTTLLWPYPFAAEEGDRLILTKACGCSIDVRPGRPEIPEFDRDQQFYMHRNRMGCWGHYAERRAADGSLEQGAGMLAILESPEDALYNARPRSNGLRAVNVGWIGEWGLFGYARGLRYCFFDRATPGTLAARYRQEMERRGYRVTFSEKARRNPRLMDGLALLKGAPDIWYWSTNANRKAIAQDLRARGMRNFLFSAIARRDLGTWVTPEEIRDVAKIPGVLCSEYDVFVDTLEPAYWDKVDCLRPHWPLDVWANGDYMTDVRGVPLRGWKVALKDDPGKPVVGCLLLCEKQAPAYVRRRIARRQAEAPFGARFLDVTGTKILECRHPRHPLTRRASARARRELVGTVGADFGLVAGTEDGLECLVPTSDYFEGGFSTGCWRIGGRGMWTTYPVTPAIEQSVDPTLRCPFFDLVFHDCVVNYWYWSDYNNRFPSLWWKHDLLNAVVGTPPMYLFTEERYAECKERIGATVERTTRTARETADCLLLEYRWLTEDRLVQESTFANGLKVVANFSDKPFALPDGRIVPARDHLRSQEPDGRSAETAPWTVDSSEGRHVAEYAPPVLANGDLGMLVDYRNCQFQDVKSYERLRSVAGEYFPATCRAGRRTMNGSLVTFGRAEEEVWVGGKNEAPRHWKQFLDVFRGESVVENAYADDAHVDSTALVAQHPAPFAALGRSGAVFAVEKRFRGPVEKYVFKWVFRRPGLSGLEPVGVQHSVKPGEIAWKVQRPQKKVAGGLAGKPVYVDTTLRGTVTLRCSDPSAAIDCDADTLRVTLTRPQGDVAFLVSFADSMDDKAPKRETSAVAGFTALRRTHEANWKAFWDGFHVTLPDKSLERTYYTALYNLKCWSTRWTTPIGIQPMHWEGKYFGYGFNARAFAGAGKLEEAKRIGRFWASLAGKARHRAGSSRACDAESGLRFAWQALEDGEEGGRSGRWLDHYMHLGTISADCWHAYRYSGDKAFLREVYPVIRGLAQYFRAWLVQETRDGRTVLGPVCDLERLPCPARNACLTTCAAIGNFEKAAAAAAALGVDATWIPEWKRLAAELRRDLPKKDGRFLAFEGCEEVSYGTITGLFPFDAVPREDPVMRASVDYFAANGVRGGNPYKIGTRICTWYAACIGADYAKLFDGEKAYRHLQLADSSVGFFHEIYEINEPVYKSVPWCQAPQGTLVQAVHDMLVQEEDGELRVAPAVPASWKDYSFRLLAPGNRIVEAACVGGKLEWKVVER